MEHSELEQRLMARNCKRKRTISDDGKIVNSQELTALLKAENERLLQEKEFFQKKMDFYKAESEKYKSRQISSEKFLSCLVNDYCFYCQRPASLRCCANHNYCSTSCRSYDTSEHGNSCPLNRSNQDLSSIDQLGILGASITIQRRTRTITTVESIRRSSQVVSTTEEYGPSTSGEKITESSDSDEDEDDSDEDDSDEDDSNEDDSDEDDSDEEQAETEEEQAEAEEEQAEAEEEQAETEEEQAETEEEQAETEEEQVETEEEQVETDEEMDRSQFSLLHHKLTKSYSQRIQASTRCYGSERMQNIHYQQ